MQLLLIVELIQYSPREGATTPLGKKTMKNSGVAIGALACMLPLLVIAQTRESGPWWPNPNWGPEDQAGASNLITPAKVMEAAQLVKTGKIYELGQLFESGMPSFGQRTYSMRVPIKAPAEGSNGVVGYDEFVSGEIGHVGTQLDGVGHIGREIIMADGQVEHVFYNGFTAREMDAPHGLQKLGIEHMRPIITRGLLIDIAGYKGVDRLPNSYEVTVADVQGALARQGISEAGIRAGDAVLFRYGWSQLWRQPDAYNHNPPGIGLEAARWIARHQAVAVGSDSWTGEVVPNPDPELFFPVHQELITYNGIFILENLKFEELVSDGVSEFLFIVTPIPFKGATGSPLRPIAIR